jgi:hypothetical protein
MIDEPYQILPRLTPEERITALEKQVAEMLPMFEQWKRDKAKKLRDGQVDTITNNNISSGLTQPRGKKK